MINIFLYLVKGEKTHEFNEKSNDKRKEICRNSNENFNSKYTTKV